MAFLESEICCCGASKWLKVFAWIHIVRKEVLKYYFYICLVSLFHFALDKLRNNCCLVYYDAFKKFCDSSIDLGAWCGPCHYWRQWEET